MSGLNQLMIKVMNLRSVKPPILKQFILVIGMLLIILG